MPQSSMNPTVNDWFRFFEIIREALKRHGAYGTNRKLLNRVEKISISFNAEQAMLVETHGWGLPTGSQIPIATLASNEFLRRISQRVWTDNPAIAGGRFHIYRRGVAWAGGGDFQILFGGVSSTRDPIAFEDALDQYRRQGPTETAWADSVFSVLESPSVDTFKLV